jgi:hypothetical protein
LNEETAKPVMEMYLNKTDIGKHTTRKINRKHPSEKNASI